MGKLSMALGDMDDMAGPPSEGSEDMEMPEEPKEKGVATAEVLAMKQFDRASTPEARAQALKDFLSACGLYDD